MRLAAALALVAGSAAAQEAVTATAAHRVLGPCLVERSAWADTLSIGGRLGWAPMPADPQPELRARLALAALPLTVGLSDLTASSPQTDWEDLAADLEVFAAGVLSRLGNVLGDDTFGGAENAFVDPATGSVLHVLVRRQGGRTLVDCTLVLTAAARAGETARPDLPPVVPGGFAVVVEREALPLSVSQRINVVVVPDPAAFEARLGRAPDAVAVLVASTTYRPEWSLP